MRRCLGPAAPLDCPTRSSGTERPVVAWPRRAGRVVAPRRSLLEVTSLGHAGLFIETRQGSILCDPWFGPAYFASWFPFPDNSGLDPAKIAQPTYLYVSHVHRDHFDRD